MGRSQGNIGSDGWGQILPDFADGPPVRSAGELRAGKEVKL